MLFGPTKGVTEKDYFLREFTADEIADGKDQKVAKWILNSESERPPSIRTEVPTEEDDDAEKAEEKN